MEQTELIASRILADMRDGVMSIDRSGTIITFNPAAERILGLQAADVTGRSFGEVFFELESNDAFNQAVLDAVYDNAVGHQKTVDFHNLGKTLTLSLTTTYLHTDVAGGSGTAGVIVVFSDITQVQELQQAEARMAEQLKVKHRELQDAFRATEAGAEQLQAALQKVKVVRRAAALFGLVLLLAMGGVYWRQGGLSGFGADRPDAAVDSAGAGSQAELTLAPEPLSSTLALTGRLAPLQTVNVNSPLSGRIARMAIQYGDVVKAGQVLLEMDTTDSLVRFREARTAMIRAEESLRQVTQWDSSADMARARRSLTKAKLALEAQKKTLDETDRLFRMGIIPSNEFESVKQQYTTQLLDYQSAEEEVQAAVARGSKDSQQIARSEYENAKVRVQQMEAELAHAVVRAPVGGIVLRPPSSGGGGGGSGGKGAKLATAGEGFGQGEILLSIGDLSGFAITSKVDEVDAVKLRAGQAVRISGDAFPGIELSGEMVGLSPQADEGDTRSLPTFLAQVVVKTVPDARRQSILVGMSANLEVVIYENPAAITVPIGAVKTEGARKIVMKKSGPGTPDVAQEVVTGYTTLDAVEIRSGLKAGDVIGLPQAAQPAGAR